MQPLRAALTSVKHADANFAQAHSAPSSDCHRPLPPPPGRTHPIHARPEAADSATAPLSLSLTLLGPISMRMPPTAMPFEVEALCWRLPGHRGWKQAASEATPANCMARVRCCSCNLRWLDMSQRVSASTACEAAACLVWLWCAG